MKKLKEILYTFTWALFLLLINLRRSLCYCWCSTLLLAWPVTGCSGQHFSLDPIGSQLPLHVHPAPLEASTGCQTDLLGWSGVFQQWNASLYQCELRIFSLSLISRPCVSFHSFKIIVEQHHHYDRTSKPVECSIVKDIAEFTKILKAEAPTPMVYG